MKSSFWFLPLMLCLLAGCSTERSPGTPPTIRVMSYNIHHGEGNDNKIDLERIADLIKREKPDIVGLQEIDRGVQRSQRRDVIAELSKLTGMEFYFDRNIIYQGGDYGNAVLTRFPILEKTNTHYQMLRPGEQRGVQQLVLKVHGRKLVFMNTHIDFRDDDEERQMNVKELKQIVAKNGGFPIILTGDFNSYPNSLVHKKLEEFLDDSWDKTGQGSSLTYPSYGPKDRIDYIWISKDRSVTPIKVWVPQSEASDHLPVMAEFRLP